MYQVGLLLYPPRTCSSCIFIHVHKEVGVSHSIRTLHLSKNVASLAFLLSSAFAYTLLICGRNTIPGLGTYGNLFCRLFSSNRTITSRLLTSSALHALVQCSTSYSLQQLDSSSAFLMISMVRSSIAGGYQESHS